MPTPRQLQLAPRLRVLINGQIALGPGKVALLAAIDSVGSLAAATRNLGMSYSRGWKLIGTMNACFATPLVKLERGGHHQGGASLTQTGRQVLRLYRDMEKASDLAAQPAWRKLRRLLAT